ncbi:hypothetical protein D9M68_236130 [compost metagenome]
MAQMIDTSAATRIAARLERTSSARSIAAGERRPSSLAAEREGDLGAGSGASVLAASAARAAREGSG